MRRLALLLGLAAALAALPATAQSSYDPPVTTTLTITGAGQAVAGSPVTVRGDVAFGIDNRQVGVDPSGDALIAQEPGADVVAARAVSDPRTPLQLRLELRLTGVLPVVQGTPELLTYRWPLVPVTEGVDGERLLEWRRTNAADVVAEDPSDPLRALGVWARLHDCTATALVRSCADAVDVAGSLDPWQATLTATAELDDLGTAPGALLETAERGIAVEHAAGPVGSEALAVDTIPVVGAYRVPTRIDSVRLGLVPEGASFPASLPVSVTPDGEGAFGSFSGAVPTAGLAPGRYDLVAEGCWGYNCGRTRTPVVLGSAGVHETLLLDSFDFANRPNGVPVSTAAKLEAGRTYDVTVRGTYSRWFVWVDSTHVVCGAAEGAPMFPSPGADNAQVGLDAETIFAYPRTIYTPQCKATPYETQAFQVNTGQGYAHPTPIGSAPGELRADHTYRYRITGHGAPATFRIVDQPTNDNYGMLEITVSEGA